MADFRTYYEQELRPLLAPLEASRKKVKRLGLLGYLVIGLFVLFIILSNGSFDVVSGVLAILSFVAIIVIWVIFWKQRKAFRLMFKEQIVRKLIGYVDPELCYEPGRCIPEREYKMSGLFQTSPDRYNGDDYLEGVHDKTRFSCSELHTEYKVNSGKNTHWETIFKGLFFIGDFNKYFSGRTYVWTADAPQLNFMSRLFSSFARELEKVNLESAEFNRRFIVYSTDQVEARYILTPSFMERLVRLQQMTSTDTSMSFVQTNIHIAIPMKEDLFEPAVFGANDFSRLEQFRATIQIVYEIIDELKLNERLWTKE